MLKLIIADQEQADSQQRKGYRRRIDINRHRKIIQPGRNILADQPQHAGRKQQQNKHNYQRSDGDNRHAQLECQPF